MNNQTQEALKMAIEAMKWLRVRPDLSILPETQAEKMCRQALQEDALDHMVENAKELELEYGK